ncbi:MAG: helix-turn-helix domain-containing protein, partial [Oscillospiraceae bacterium]|nr:helix-turn-helix domain-containing protein [Oscillospiraceae bacterium]
MALGDRIKEARKRCGITQLDLSKALGVAKSTVAGWEKNHEPTVAQVGQIADFLGVDANYLLQDEIKSRYERTASSDEMERLVKRFRALDEHGK